MDFLKSTLAQTKDDFLKSINYTNKNTHKIQFKQVLKLSKTRRSICLIKIIVCDLIKIIF